MEKQLFKNLKILSSFALFISNTKNAHILNFFIRKIFRQTFIIYDFFYFLFLRFAKNFMEKPPVFIMEVEFSHKLLLSGEDLTSRNFC